MIHIMDLIGVAVFAVTGALVAGRKKMDLFGVIVIANVTALGGGTIRDVTLGTHPVFWVVDPTYVVVAVIASLVTFISAHFASPPLNFLLIADAFGLAIFTIIGSQNALEAGISNL